MTMHGMFWRFPKTFSLANSADIRPRSTCLKVIGDFCRWNDRLVFGCDDLQAQDFTKSKTAIPQGVLTVDAGSVVYVDDKGQCWRLPKGDAAFDEFTGVGLSRIDARSSPSATSSTPTAPSTSCRPRMLAALPKSAPSPRTTAAFSTTAPTAG